MGRIRFAARSLAKAPLLSLVVVASLGLGIGVNTACWRGARSGGGSSPSARRWARGGAN